MAEYKTPASEAEFAANFAQLKPLMNATEAYYESARCLFCHDAPCMTACPTGIDIPLFIKQIHSGNLLGSAKTIYASNYFGYSCGKVCPTEVLCEGACVYNHQEMRPVDIGRLQSVATATAIGSNAPLFSVAPANGKRVAVIGAGPAGIACACELRTKGYSVEVFEAKEKPSGLTVYGVAPYKITNEEALGEMAYLQQQFGFSVHYNHRIGSAEQLRDLESRFEAVFIGIGLGSTRFVGIPGEDFEGVYGAVEFIEDLRMGHHDVPVGRNVVVIGGGNTAMDAASESARMGAESVVLAYRKGKEDMSAYEFEYDLAKGVGVKGLFHVTPVEIVGDGKAEGVLFRRADEAGETELLLPCDMVIRATGQEKQGKWLSQIPGLQVDGAGRIITKDYRCTHPKYWAGGDAVNGGAEVVNAAAEGKAAAKSIHLTLSAS